MFDISRQAYLYMWIWIVTSVINMIATAYMFGVSGLLSYMLAVVIMLPLLLLYLYHIDCLTYGDCNTLSWIITILMSLTLIGYSLLVLFSTVFIETSRSAFEPIDVDPENNKAKDATDKK